MSQLALPAQPAAHRVTGWDRAAVATLGTAGFALSFDALQQMALAVHVRGLLSYLFPLLIDGFIAYGIRALILLRTAAFRARLYAWTLFAAATAASIWANALHAVRLNQQAPNGSLRLGDATVGVLSTLAPLALAGAVHLYILIARQAGDAGQGPVPGDFHTPTAAPCIPSSPDALSFSLSAETNSSTQHSSRTSEQPTATPPASRTEPAAPEGRQGRPPGAEFEAMLPIARKAAAEHGRLSRQVVRNAVRASGLTIGDERLTALMTRLRAEQPSTHT